METQKLLDSCYFCTTPFQIIGAISLVIEKRETSDLYIIGQFDSYKEIVNNIKVENIFRQVIAVEEDKFAKIRSMDSFFKKGFNILNWYVDSESITNNILYDNTNYRKMYFTSQTLISRIIRLNLMRNYPEMKFIQIDEGVGSYFESAVFRIGFLDKVLRRIMFGKKALEKDIQKLLYIPEISTWWNQKNGCNTLIGRMPRINKQIRVANIINDVFNFESKDKILEKVIIFDTLRIQIYGNKGAKVLTSYYSKILKFFGTENVINKRHPRENGEYNDNLREYCNKSMPAEVIYQNIDIENKILVSTFSTSCITPKLLFDKEPIVIMLYKLMNPYNNYDSNMDRFFNEIKNQYIRPERFIILEDINELESILSNLLGSEE